MLRSERTAPRGDRAAIQLGGATPKAVLALLLLNADEAVSAERLARALWGEDTPQRAIRTVQVHVSRLRKAPGDPDVLTRLPVRPGELDVERFPPRSRVQAAQHLRLG